ncbi:lonely Cys domain-containing protein [Streptomyces canus]
MAFTRSGTFEEHGDRVLELRDRVADLLNKVDGALPPEVADRFKEAMATLVTLNGSDQMSDFSDQFRQKSRNQVQSSRNIMESKFEIIAEAFRLLGELAFIAAMSIFTGGLSFGDTAAAKARSTVAILTILDRLLRQTHLLPSLSEAVEEALTTFAVRLAMLALNDGKRRPDGIDWTAIGKSAAVGALAGMFSSVIAKNIGTIYKKQFNNFNNSKWGNFGGDVFRHFTSEGPSEAVAEYLVNGLFDGKWKFSPMSLAGGGLSAVVENIISNEVADIGKNLNSKFFGGQNNPTAFNPLPGPDSPLGAGAGNGLAGPKPVVHTTSGVPTSGPTGTPALLVPPTTTSPTAHDDSVHIPMKDVEADLYPDTDWDTETLADTDGNLDTTDWDTETLADPDEDTYTKFPAATADPLGPAPSPTPEAGAPSPLLGGTPLPDPVPAENLSSLPSPPPLSTPSVTPSTTPSVTPLTPSRGQDSTVDTGFDGTLEQPPLPEPLPDPTVNVPDTGGLPHSTGVPGDGSTGHGANPAAAGATPRPSTQSETFAVPETETGMLPDEGALPDTQEAAPSATPDATTGRPPTAAGQGNTSVTSPDAATRPTTHDQDGTVTTDDGTRPTPSSDEVAQPLPHHPPVAEPVRDPVRQEQWRPRQQDAPATLLHTEIHAPEAAEAPDAYRDPATQPGQDTVIRAEVQRVPADDGRFVRSLTLDLPVRFGDGFPANQLQQFEERMREALDAQVNHGLTLPRSGDQLHIDLNLVHDSGDPEAIELTATDTPAPSSQFHIALVPVDPALAAPDRDRLQTRNDATALRQILRYAGIHLAPDAAPATVELPAPAVPLDQLQTAEDLTDTDPALASAPPATAITTTSAGLPAETAPTASALGTETSSPVPALTTGTPGPSGLGDSAAIAGGRGVPATAGRQSAPDRGPVIDFQFLRAEVNRQLGKHGWRGSLLDTAEVEQLHASLESRWKDRDNTIQRASEIALSWMSGGARVGLRGRGSSMEGEHTNLLAHDDAYDPDEMDTVALAVGPHGAVVVFETGQFYVGPGGKYYRLQDEALRDGGPGTAVKMLMPEVIPGVMANEPNEDRPRPDSAFAVYEQVERAFDAIPGELGGAPHVPIENVLTPELGWEITEEGQGWKIGPRPVGEWSGAYLQHNIGVPMAVMHPFLRHVHQNTWRDQSYGFLTRDHLADALDFADDVAARFIASRALGMIPGDIRPARALIDMPDLAVQELRSHAVSLYVVAAMLVNAEIVEGLDKAHAAMLVRRDPDVLLASLPPSARQFLASDVSAFLGMLEERIRDRIPNAPANMLQSEPLRNGHRIYDFLGSGLVSEYPRRTELNDVTNINVFIEPDVGGTLPKEVVEVRSYVQWNARAGVARELHERLMGEVSSLTPLAQRLHNPTDDDLAEVRNALAQVAARYHYQPGAPRPGLYGGTPGADEDPLLAGWEIGRRVPVEGPRRGGGLVRVPVANVPGPEERKNRFTYRLASTSQDPVGYSVDDAGEIRLPLGHRLPADEWTRLVDGSGLGDDFVHLGSGAVLRGNDGWIGRVDDWDTLRDAIESGRVASEPYRLVPRASGLYLVPRGADGTGGARDAEAVHIPLVGTADGRPGHADDRPGHGEGRPVPVDRPQPKAPAPLPASPVGAAPAPSALATETSPLVPARAIGTSGSADPTAPVPFGTSPVPPLSDDAKLDVGRRFSALMRDLGHPVVLAGGARGRVQFENPRPLGTLEFQLSADVRLLADVVNQAIAQIFPEASPNALRVGDDGRSLTGVVQGTEISLGIHGPTSTDTTDTTEIGGFLVPTVSQSLADTAYKLALATGEQQRMRDLFDLLWGLSHAPTDDALPAARLETLHGDAYRAARPSGAAPTLTVRLSELLDGVARNSETRPEHEAKWRTLGAEQNDLRWLNTELTTLADVLRATDAVAADPIRQLASRLPGMPEADRTRELALLSPAERERLASDPVLAETLWDALPASEFARTAAQLMVQVPAGVDQPVSARDEAQAQIARALRDPDVTARLLKNGARMIVVPRSEAITTLDPFRGLAGQNRPDGRSWDELRGVGLRTAGVTEENLLGEFTSVPGTGPAYPDGYSTTLHEFAHTIHRYGLSESDQQDIHDAYQATLDEYGALWPDGALHGMDAEGRRTGVNYSSRDELEFFAQLTNVYLRANRGKDPYTGETRQNGGPDWVRRHQPTLFPLMQRLYGADPDAVYAGPVNPVEATQEQNEIYEGFRALWDQAEGTHVPQPHTHAPVPAPPVHPAGGITDAPAPPPSGMTPAHWNALTAALIQEFGPDAPTNPAFPQTLNTLAVLDAARRGDRNFGTGPIDLRGLTRRVLHLAPGMHVTPELVFQALSVTGSAEKRGRAGSLAAVAAYHLERSGALSTATGLNDDGHFKGRNLTGRKLHLLLDRTGVQDRHGAFHQVPSLWGQQAYAVVAERAPSGLIVLDNGQGNPVEIDQDELLELVVHDPSRTPGVPVVLLVDGVSESMARRLADRINTRVWHTDGTLRLESDSDGSPWRYPGLANPNLGTIPVGIWIPSDPGLVPDEPDAVVAMHDGTWVREDELSTYTLTTVDGQRGVGRAYLSALDMASTEGAVRELAAVEHYVDVYLGTPGVEATRESGLRPLPRKLGEAYIAAGHGAAGYPGVVERSTGHRRKLREGELGRLLSRSKSLQRMRPENPVWLLWCELGQVRPGRDRLESPPEGQDVADLVGRQVFTAESRQGWQRKAEGTRLLKYDDPDKPQFRYREFRPRPDDTRLTALADMAGLPAHVQGRSTRALRWVRALRETHGVDIDTSPSRVAEFQNLIRGFGALESLRMNAPGNRDTGPLTWRSLAQIVGDYAEGQGWDRSLSANALEHVLYQAQTGKLPHQSVVVTAPAAPPVAQQSDALDTSADQTTAGPGSPSFSPASGSQDPAHAFAPPSGTGVPTSADGPRPRGDRKPVPGDGNGLLYAFMASDPRYLRDRLPNLAAAHPEAYAWLGDPERVRADLGDRAKRDTGPHLDVADAMRHHVADYLARVTREGRLPEQIAYQYRAWSPDTLERVTEMDRARLLEELRSADVALPEVQVHGVLETHTTDDLRDLLLRHKPLDSAEHVALTEAVVNWERNGNTPEGEAFLPLLTHAFDVRATVAQYNRTGETTSDEHLVDVGPDSAIREIEIFRDMAVGHYSGSDAGLLDEEKLAVGLEFGELLRNLGQPALLAGSARNRIRFGNPRPIGLVEFQLSVDAGQLADDINRALAERYPGTPGFVLREDGGDGPMLTGVIQGVEITVGSEADPYADTDEAMGFTLPTVTDSLADIAYAVATHTGERQRDDLFDLLWGLAEQDPEVTALPVHRLEMDKGDAYARAVPPGAASGLSARVREVLSGVIRNAQVKAGHEARWQDLGAQADDIAAMTDALLDFADTLDLALAGPVSFAELRDAASRLTGTAADERASEPALLSSAERELLASNPTLVNRLGRTLPAPEFAEVAAQLMVQIPAGVDQPVSARQEAQAEVARMLRDPEVAMELLKRGERIVVVPRSEAMTSLDAFRHLAGQNTPDGRPWEAMRGVRPGAGRTVVPEENLLGEDPPAALNLPRYADGYSLTTHETAHAIELVLSEADQQLIEAAYQDNVGYGTGGIWPDGPLYGMDAEGRRTGPNYSSRNRREFFAQLVNAYPGDEQGTRPVHRRGALQRGGLGGTARADAASALPAAVRHRPSGC